VTPQVKDDAKKKVKAKAGARKKTKTEKVS
jgi:hypothetical protein